MTCICRNVAGHIRNFSITILWRRSAKCPCGNEIRNENLVYSEEDLNDVTYVPITQTLQLNRHKTCVLDSQ
jgi:hypothetical protein